MKVSSSSAAVACLWLSNADAFAPVSSSPKQSTTTTLNLRSDQEMFDSISLGNGGVNGVGYMGDRNMDGGYTVGGYRTGGRDFFPTQSRGGAMAPIGAYNNGYGFQYGYNGYDQGYGNTVQGESRKTFSTTYSDSSTVQLETDGRPLNANVEVWQGAGHSPAKMRLYSEDGYLRPWTAGFANTPRGGYTSAVTVNNEASTAFPIRANPLGNAGPAFGGGSYGGGYMGGMQRGGYMGGMQGGMGGQSYTGSSRNYPINIDGGALRTFSFGPTRAIVVEIWSDDFPFYADVELWDGPNAVKQAAEVYSDSGRDRPWSAVIENPRGGTISVRNVGPLEFPMKVCVEPIY